MVETRGLAFTGTGREDILFFISHVLQHQRLQSHGYQNAPTRLQARLRQQGASFQQLNAAAGTVLPADGYTIRDMYVAIGTDMDVTFNNSGTNYNGVNVPLRMGFTYHATFTGDRPGASMTPRSTARRSSRAPDLSGEVPQDS